jgi:uridine phosphorylase
MNNQPLRPSDLLINEDGSIYHLHLRPEELADTILIVGDPERTDTIAGFFEKIEVSKRNREFYSHTGYYRGMRITALSTGIGTDNIDIVLNELDALANIDFETRLIKEHHRTLRIIRLGTSGSVNPNVPSGAIVLASYGLGIDGTMQYYEGLDSVTDHHMTGRFIEEMNWPSFLPKPYIVPGSQELIRLFEEGTFKGITVTAPGFYASQGRELRLATSLPGMLDKIGAFSCDGHQVMNFEMETAALYGLAKLLGHQATSVCVILANRALGTYEPKYKDSVKEMITMVLNRLTT